jgi:hypothetical protein
MNIVSLFLIPCFFIPLIVSESRKERKELLCAACIAVVDEIEWEIEKVDPKKTLQVTCEWCFTLATSSYDNN